MEVTDFSSPQNARMSKLNVKTMLTAFFDCKGVVHHESAPQGETVTKEYYLAVLKRLREKIRRPQKWADNSFLLYHDNAPAHCEEISG